MPGVPHSPTTGRALHIQWIVDGVEGQDLDSYRSTLASHRYRAILPARALAAAGHRVELLPAERWHFDARAPHPDAIVIGKILPSRDAQRFPRLSRQLLDQARAAAADGVRVLADFNDDHFDRPVVGEHWRTLARSATACVAGTETMAQLVRRHTRAPIVVVGDPVAAPQGAARVFQAPNGAGRWVRGLLGGAGSQSRLKLVWYGHPVNWPAMRAWSRALEPLCREQPYLLWAVTQPDPMIEADIDAHNRRCGPAGLMELVPWDEETQWATVSDADVVLIPSDPADPKKAVKTSNRLTDALHAGRAVIASPLPAYQAFAGQVTLTDAPLEALREMLAQPERTLARLRAGQQVVIERCGLPAVARQWAEACGGALPQRAQEPAAPAEAATDGGAQAVPVPEPMAAPVRLNLGCGDKILAGFVNVDVVEARAGQRPDVICDLHQLHPFSDDSADEVMAIHVVEHFWRWEVEEVLREWLRVLKPGGRMVLECPNLLSAARELLADPEQRARADQAGQRSMWVFYGDPGWKDPLMIHRWGYTPASLAELMRQVGLVNVRQEPAQYKLREPRDMRLVGDKPR